MGLKNILVTGSEGYIGTILVPMLIKNKFNVIGLDTCYYGFFNKYKNFKLIKKDIRNINSGDLKNIDAVIHLAALSNDPMGELNTRLTMGLNYRTTIKLAKIAKKNKVKRFLFSSSCSIYGIAKSETVDESSQVNPLTAYAKSKILSEKYLMKLANDNFCIGLLRNSTVYGYSPNLRCDLVVNDFVSSAVINNKITIKSDGTPWRPLIDVRDLSRIFIEFLLVEKNIINGKIFNIGFNENNFQINKILKKIQKISSKCKIIHSGEHGKDTRSYKVCFDKFKTTFPTIKQKWTMDKAIKDMFQQLKNTHFSKTDFEQGKFTRLTVLKKLMMRNKIDNYLKWTQ